MQVGVKQETLPAIDSASVLICIQGRATVKNPNLTQPINLGRGTILFIAANQSVDVEIDPAEGMLLYRAHTGYQQ